MNEITPEHITDLVDTSEEAALADALVTRQFVPRDDPAMPHYPRGLVLDLCLKTAPVEDLLQAYKISVADFKRLVEHPVFRAEIREMREKLREEGFSFRVKAQAQAEAYLHEAWNIIHNPETPANVRADLIKATVKWANLEPKADASTQVAVNVDMRGMSEADLNARVMSIVMKKAKNPPHTSAEAIDVAG